MATLLSFFFYRTHALDIDPHLLAMSIECSTATRALSSDKPSDLVSITPLPMARNIDSGCFFSVFLHDITSETPNVNAKLFPCFLPRRLMTLLDREASSHANKSSSSSPPWRLSSKAPKHTNPEILPLSSPIPQVLDPITSASTSSTQPQSPPPTSRSQTPPPPPSSSSTPTPDPLRLLRGILPSPATISPPLVLHNTATTLRFISNPPH